MSRIKNLPKKLNQLIDTSLNCLYEVIREQEGETFFSHLWVIRKRMRMLSRLSVETKEKYLSQTFQEIKQFKRAEQHLIAHSFTLMMEVINACETTYRTHRIQLKKSTQLVTPHDNVLAFILTAHPTEARSPANIAVFQSVQAYCLDLLKNPAQQLSLNRLKHVLKLAWLIPVSRHKRPSVLDEAESIFSIILRHDCLDTMLKLRQQGIDVRMRTWVGGDKDGHPGVDETIMIQVMNLARGRFVEIIRQKLNHIIDDFRQFKLKLEAISAAVKTCHRCLTPLTKLNKHDHLHLTDFQQAFVHLKDCYQQTIGACHPEIVHISTLMDVFPALLIPLEIREDASQLHLALKNKQPLPIKRMIRALVMLCRKGNIEGYVKGFVISMTESQADIHAGMRLLSQYPELDHLRVVPLFETETALNQAGHIIKQLFDDKSFRQHIRQHWHNQFEIMLGYSDSSKGMGVLASRLAIANTMRVLDELCGNYQVTPIFFHGSGGSIDRGGGSIQEQTAWWPQSSFNVYKTTIQGEMVERCFATPELFNDMVFKFLLESEKKHEFTFKHHQHVQAFANQTLKYYQAKICDPQFLRVVSQATSYRMLDKLKMGSRPAKRTKSLTVDSLRAIPWVLCWTQTRTLFPTWWGVGSAWHDCTPGQKQLLIKAYEDNSLFRAFIKLLGFTLAKVDLSIWQLYLSTSDLDQAVKRTTYIEFEKEFEYACQAVFELTQQSNLIWFRPWLNESIRRRTAFVSPLNVIQIIAIQEQDEFLMRETTTGIAAGMLTTG